MEKYKNKLVNKFMTTNICKLYVVMLGIHFLWILVVGMTFILCEVKFSQHVASTSQFKNSLFLIPMYALVEEMIFRWIPMLIVVAIVTIIVKARHLENLEHAKRKWMLITLIGVSILFGYVHGNIFNVFVQGVSALFFSAFYLRAYIRSNPEKKLTRWQLLPLISATLFHTMSNAIMIF